MRIFIIIFFLISGFAGNSASAQQDPYTDSLLRVLDASRHDSTKAQILMMLSDYWADRDSAQAVDFARQSLSFTKNRSYLKGRAHFYLAGAYFNYDRARSQQEYMKADSLLARFSTAEAFWYRSRAWHNYGVLDQEMDNSRSFVDILLTKAIPLAEAAGDRERVAWNYMDLGAVFMNYKDYTKADMYYEKAITILRDPKYSDRPVLAECYINQVKVRLFEGRAGAANAPLTEAHKVLQSAADSSCWPLYYEVKGMYHRHLGQWKEAHENLDKGLEIALRREHRYNALSIQYEIYEAYKREGKLAKARLALEEVYKGYKQYPIAQNGRRILYELAQTEAALGNHSEAYNRLLEYAQLSDSFFVRKTGKEIADLEAKYRVAAQEKTLLQLRNRNRVQQLLLLFGAGIIILLTGFFSYVYRQRKKREAQRALAIQQEQEITITRAMLEGEERERKRLARDLHDGLGGMLAGVKLNLSAINHDKKNGAQLELEKVIGQLDDSVHELRRIARNMMPEALLRAGLAHALESLCRSINGRQMHVEYELINLPENLPHREKVDIYRIVQELLANAVRHSDATDVFLQCSERNGRFYITIEDNGKGMFTTQGNRPEEGLGLANIRSRVDQLQGRMELESRPGNGTIINIEINVTTVKAY